MITNLRMDLFQALSQAHLVGVHAQLLPLHVAPDVVVRHADAELDVVLHVHHAAVRVVLGVDLAREDLVGGDGGDHLGGPAVDGDVVAGAELEGSLDVCDDEEGVLDVGEGGGGVVGQTTYPVTRVAVVKTVTPAKSSGVTVSRYIIKIKYLLSTLQDEFSHINYLLCRRRYLIDDHFFAVYSVMALGFRSYIIYLSYI